MPRRVLHILSDADWGGTGIARIVSAIACGIDPQKYEIRACFIGKDGPLVEEFQKQGIPTSVVKWRHPHRDPVGLLRLWWRLRKERFDVVHLHWGGRAVRIACNAKVLLHLHSHINKDDLRTPHAISTVGCDAVIAASHAAARLSSHSNTRVVYYGINILENPLRSFSHDIKIGTAGRLVPLKGITYLLH